MTRPTTTPPLHTHRTINTTPAIRRETVAGRAYLVAPVVSARVGVMNGVLYEAGELLASVSAWDGVPAPVGHPTGPGGEFVSASADVSPGVVQASRFERGRLYHEIWIDLGRAQALGDTAQAVVNRLEGGQVIEVSTGLYADIEPAQGVYNGRRYYGIARNIRPDHVAILLDEVGACSVADGCGIPRANRRQQMAGQTNKPAGESSRLVVQVDLTLDDQREAVYRAWWKDDEADGSLRDIFPDRMIVKRDGRLFQIPYSVDDDGEVSFDEPVEVEYRPVENGGESGGMSNAAAIKATRGSYAHVETPDTNKGNDAAMPGWAAALKNQIFSFFNNQEAKQMDRKNVIQTLLANERNALRQETLDAMSDEELEAYAGQVSPCQASAGSASGQANSEQASAGSGGEAQGPVEQPVTRADFEALMETVTGLAKQLTANADAEKSGYIKQIVANSDVFTEAELAEKSLADVQKLHKALRLSRPADYSGRGLPVVANNDEWVDYERPALNGKGAK